MRPLTLPVQVETEQEEDGDQFVLNLPDGTSQKQVSIYSFIYLSIYL